MKVIRLALTLAAAGCALYGAPSPSDHDARSEALWMDSGDNGIATYGNRWSLDGTTQLDTPHSTALVATNAVASLAVTHPRAVKFVEALWSAAIPSAQYRYYDGMWYLMGLLHCSGEYRIWTPKWALVSAPGSPVSGMATLSSFPGTAASALR